MGAVSPGREGKGVPHRFPRATMLPGSRTLSASDRRLPSHSDSYSLSSTLPLWLSSRSMSSRLSVTPWSVLTHIQTARLQRLTSEYHSPISKPLNLLPRQHPEHNHAIQPLLKSLPASVNASGFTKRRSILVQRAPGGMPCFANVLGELAGVVS